jgi:hypothetical protein
VVRLKEECSVFVEGASITDRRIPTYVQQVALTFHEIISHEGVEYQKKVLRKCFKQPLLQPLMPNFVVKENKLQQCEAICENIGATWKDLKYGKGKDHYYAHHVVAMVIVSTQSNSNILATKNCVGLNYISI